MSRPVSMSLRAAVLSVLVLGSDAGAQVVPSSGHASPPGQAIREIPPAFRGLWAHVAADCRAGLSAIRAAPVLTIDAEGLKQMEGGFVVTRVLRTPGDLERISLDAHDSGGGEEWDTVEEFTLSKDRRILDWRRIAPNPGPATRLHRCR